MPLSIDAVQKRSPAAPGRPLSALLPVTFTPAARAILLLSERSCRWPIGSLDDDDFHFCNDRKEPGRSYCTVHRRASRAGAAR